MVEFIQTFIDVLTRPTQFFTRVKNEKDFMTPWLYYVVVLVIYNIISYLVSIPRTFMTNDLESLGVTPAVNIALNGGFTLFSVILGMGLIFVGAGIMHLFLMIVGAKEYIQTFKIVCYSSTISLLVAPLMIVTVVPLGQIIWILIALGAAIGAYIVEVIGAKVMHGLSTARAVVGIVVIPILFVIIIVTIAVIFFVSLFFAAGGMQDLTGMLISKVI